LAMALPSNALGTFFCSNSPCVQLWTVQCRCIFIVADSDGKLDAHVSNKDNSAEVNVSDIYNLPADEENEDRSNSHNPSRGTSFSFKDLPNGTVTVNCIAFSCFQNMEDILTFV
jgi:hypothetical protein